MYKKIDIPTLSERQRYDLLDNLSVNQSILIDVNEQYRYSNVASQFHRITQKKFKTSRKGQPEGKAIVWRVQ